MTLEVRVMVTIIIIIAETETYLIFERKIKPTYVYIYNIIFIRFTAVLQSLIVIINHTNCQRVNGKAGI